MRLQTKFFISVTALLIAITLAGGWVFIRSEKAHAREHVIDELHRVQALLHAARADLDDPRLENHVAAGSNRMREIFERYIDSHPQYRYRQISDDPLNPLNQADTFEQNVLAKLRENPNQNEVALTMPDPEGREWLVAARPIIADASCLSCHSSPVEAAVQPVGQLAGKYQPGAVVGALMVAIPTREIAVAQAIVTQNVLVLGIGLAATILAMVALTAFKMVTTPIRSMSDHMDRVASEQRYDQPLPQAQRSDELGTAARAFNRVLDVVRDNVHKLSDANQTLEQRVAERTAELARNEQERLRNDVLERDRAEVLEMVAKNQPLGEQLNRLVQMVEHQRPGMRGILMVLRSGELVVSAAPSLPPECLAMSPQAIPPFGTAVQNQVPAICQDLTEEFLDDAAPEALRSLSVRACWVVPIMSGANEVLGALGLLGGARGAATQQDLDLLLAAARVAAIAIEHHELSARLAYQAQHDPLTGLPNRVLLDERLRRSLSRARHDGSTVGVMVIDVDGFKHINDTLGHHGGDIFLQLIAQRLQNVIRPGDTLVRVGGDEFTVVAPEVGGKENAAALSRRVLDVFATTFEVTGHEFYATASIGVAVAPQDGDDPAIVQRNADAAMYRAKRNGRNRVECFGPEIGTAVVERLEMETQLRRAIENREFELYYQPKVDRDGLISGVEALVRWRHPKRGIVPPMQFIPMAEESGVILPIGTWVLEEACRQGALWIRKFGRSPRISVNVSALQFAQADFVETITQALDSAALDPELLELEITESLLMQHTQEAMKKLAEIRRMGVSIAIDDFGTGYSSLAYLNRLPIDTLKIEQSFVQDLETADGMEERSAIIRAIISLAHGLRLNVVAEGVETIQQLEFLLKVGCEEMQGNLFSPPRPVSDIEPLLEGNLPIGPALELAV